MSKLEAKGVGNLATRLADKLSAVSSLIEQERCSTDRVGKAKRRGNGERYTRKLAAKTSDLVRLFGVPLLLFLPLP